MLGSASLTPWPWLGNGDGDDSGNGDTTEVEVGSRWFELRLELRLLALLERSHLSTIPRTWPFARVDTVSASEVSAKSGELETDRKACPFDSSSSSGSDVGVPHIRPRSMFCRRLRAATRRAPRHSVLTPSLQTFS